MSPRTFRAGDWVEVKSAAEIMATLDGEGRLDALPFMPEMLQYCGQKFQVFKSAHKSCNTLGGGGIRQMPDAVHLDGLRCDGGSHGGCQASCMLFWKAAWLKPAGAPAGQTGGDASAADPPAGAAAPVCTLETLVRSSRTPASDGAPEGYRCQATELSRATAPARWWDPRLYVRDLTSGNVRLWQLVRYGLQATMNNVLRLARLRTYPDVRGLAAGKTPNTSLDLRAGEWVQVRSENEIMGTLNGKARNQGLLFDVEMLPYCGGTFRVLRRVERLVDERTGRMISPRKPCIILDGVTCGGFLSRSRMFCPRSIYPYWHETWLQRAPAETPGSPPESTAARHDSRE